MIFNYLDRKGASRVGAVEFLHNNFGELVRQKAFKRASIDLLDLETFYLILSNEMVTHLSNSIIIAFRYEACF